MTTRDESETRRHYVWDLGVKRLGLALALVTPIVMFGLMIGFSPRQYVSWRFLSLLLLSFLIMPAVGYAWGVMTWRTRRRREMIAHDGRPEAPGR